MAVYIGAENFQKRPLPSGYTQLEYIQSSGTQYIDTGFVPKGTTRVVMDFEFPTNPSTSYTAPWVLFGARTSATSNNYAFMSGADSTNASNKYFRSDYNGTYTQEWHITQTGRKTVDKNKNVTTLNGTTQTYTSANFTAPGNLMLFALNNNGTVQWHASMRLYSCQIYDNGTLVRDFVPCKNSSGTIGLIDLVKSVFYANAGSGAFTAGNAYLQQAAMEVNDIDLGVSAMAREVDEGFLGVSAVARRVWGMYTAKDFSVGESVYMNVGGISKEFIIVHQGLPSSDYDISCDGTWLLMKDIYIKKAFDTESGGGTNDYVNSDINSYLNDTFINLFDTHITNTIKTVKIPYTHGTGILGSVRKGSSGLAVRSFLLSCAEVGLIEPSYVNTEGAELSYFIEKTTSDYIAYHNGIATGWFLRSPDNRYDINVRSISDDGSHVNFNARAAAGIRPALILPSDTAIDENYNIVV